MVTSVIKAHIVAVKLIRAIARTLSMMKKEPKMELGTEADWSQIVHAVSFSVVGSYGVVSSVFLATEEI